MEIPPKLQAGVLIVCCSQQTDNWTLLLWKISTQLIKHGEACMEPLTLCSSLFGVEKCSQVYKKGSTDNKPATESMPTTLSPACKICRDNDGKEFMGMANQCPI